jgi:DNA-binding IclR family transcriptional regulator
MQNNDVKKIDKYSAPALSKGLDILEFLAKEAQAQKKADIARALDRSISEIFRMLVVLEQREYVAFDTYTERYSLTTKLFEISHQHPPIRRISSIAGEAMQRLAQRINQSAHLAILSDEHVLVIAQVNSPGNNVTSVRLGARIPIFQTASGAVLTAYFTGDDRLRLDNDLKSATRTQRKIYQDSSAMMLNKHYCECPSMVIEGVMNISVPIQDHGGEVIAALTIPFIKRLNDPESVSRTDARKALIETGNDISKLLGASVAK